MQDSTLLPDDASRCAKDDSTEAFMRLLADHHRSIFSYILALVPDEHRAEEIFQEVSITLWREFSHFEPGTHFFRWASVIVLNQVRNFRRKQDRDRHLFSAEMLEQLAEQRDALSAELEERRVALAICLQTLSTTDRELVERCYSDQASFKCVAKEFGRPANTVYKALNRIRHALLRCIESRLGLEGNS